jgi:hypothetical protein
LSDKDITVLVRGAVGCNSWPGVLLWTPNSTQRLVCKFATATKDFVNKETGHMNQRVRNIRKKIAWRNKKKSIKQNLLGIRRTYLHEMLKERRQKPVSEKIKKQNVTED